jgi:hypothetical protein
VTVLTVLVRPHHRQRPFQSGAGRLGAITATAAAIGTGSPASSFSTWVTLRA